MKTVDLITSWSWKLVFAGVFEAIRLAMMNPNPAKEDSMLPALAISPSRRHLMARAPSLAA